MYLMRSRLELRDVVSKATRRFSISMELTVSVLICGASHGTAQASKCLILPAKLALGLTLCPPAGRTAPASAVDISRRGLDGLAEGWPSGRRRRFAKPLMGVNPIRRFESHPLRHFFSQILCPLG